MNLDTKLSIPPQVMSRPVGDETVLLDLSSGIYFGVDGVAKCIWDSLADGNTIGGAAAAVAAEFDVDEATAQADAIAFANDLVERGLLVQ